MTEADQALLELLSFLEAQDYAFVTPTPETHKRALRRPRAPGPATLRDVFGWSRAFAPDELPAEVMDIARRAGVLKRRGRLLASTLRVSTVRDRLFLHSAYPTHDENSVFLGPDSYRFADFIVRELRRAEAVERMLDIGAGAGVGGITAAGERPGAALLMTDVNAAALRLAQVNAAHNRIPAELRIASGLDGVEGRFDLITANPPYIVDTHGRTYRDGGDMLGARLSLEWAQAAAERLASGGRLLLYTGSAIVE
ncbi:MAG: class I SAM-dependent methyltransferase, partial [Pseudomonadota bacterium]|nr:class I SAM-dependent methyltransferase [Pseudomonadota bacterium]